MLTSKRNKFISWLFIYSITLFLFHTPPAIASPADGESTVAAERAGVVDSIVNEGRQVTAQGWAASGQKDKPLIEIQVKLKDRIVYLGSFKVIPRPDVATSFKQPDWLMSGWKVTFKLPADIKPGTYPAEIAIKTQAGEWINVGNSPSAKELIVTQDRTDQKRKTATLKYGLVAQ